MSVELQGLRTVIDPAPDLAAAKAWWTELLGFTPYFDEPFDVGFAVGDGIATATVRSPDGSIVGLIKHPHVRVSA